MPSLCHRDVDPAVFCGLRGDYGDALGSSQHVGAFAVAVINECKGVVGGLQERASAAHPNEPAFDGVVLTELASVYGQLGVRALDGGSLSRERNGPRVEVHPNVFELVF